MVTVTAGHAPNIGYILYGQDRPLGGIGRYTAALRQALQGLGLPVLDLRAGSRPAGSRALTLPGARLLPALLTIGQLEIACLARRYRLALVHDPTGACPHLLGPGARVTTVHDLIPYRYQETSTALDRIIYHRWLPHAVGRLDAIVTVSEQTRLDLHQLLSVPMNKITVIPLAAGRRFRPLPEAAIRPALARQAIDGPYILYVGALTPRKNVGRLLLAYARLRPWVDRWRLVITGGRPAVGGPLLQTVRRLALGPQVQFTGFVTEADLPALYNGADLVVFPSLYEGFGLPVLEAMACGTPVVTSNTSSLPEVAAGAALLVDPTGIDAIAAAMRQILEDHDLAAHLRARGLARAAEFSWERTARETIQVYERVLDRTPPAGKKTDG
jgi:glycosyltransferase involved in cell wall biosynthesis